MIILSLGIALLMQAHLVETPARPSPSIQADVDCLNVTAARLDDRISDATTIAKVVASECRHHMVAALEANESTHSSSVSPQAYEYMMKRFDEVQERWALKAVLEARASRRLKKP